MRQSVTLPQARHALALALCAALAPATAGAQTTPLNPVTVSAPAAQRPLGAQIPDDESWRSLRALTSESASLLRTVPGVQFYGAGGVSSLPVIQGLGDDRLRVKLDGMDLISSCPNHMNPPLSYLDPAQAGAFKVYAGVAPVSAGGDSIGGAILAESLTPEFTAGGARTRADASASYRDNGHASRFSLSASHAAERFSASYAGALSAAGDYHTPSRFKSTTATGRPEHTLPLDVVGSTAFESRQHSLGLAWKNGADVTEFKYGYQDIPKQLFPNQRMDMLDNEQHRLNLRHRGQMGWGTLDARVWHETVYHYMNFGDDKQFWYGMPANIPGMPMYTESKNSGLSLKAEKPHAGGLLRAGLEYQRYRLDDWWPPSGGMMMAPDTHINIANGKRDRLGLFGEWEGSLAANWTALLGARFERVHTDAGDVDAYGVAAPPEQTQFNSRSRKKTDNNLDWSALARHTPDATLDIEFGLARKTRSPNLYERYAWRTRMMEMLMINTAGDGNGYVGDIDLSPERAHTASLTLDWHTPDRSAGLRLTPYITQVSDYIDAVRCTTANTVAGSGCPAANTATNTFVQLKYANQAARLYGADLSGHAPLGKTGWGEFGLEGAAGYTRGKNRDTGDDLYNIMPLNLRLALRHQQAGWDNRVEFQTVAAKDRLSDVRNEIRTGGYSLVNLRASHAWKQVQLDFGVENLFDKAYSNPLGGAYVGQGATMGVAGTPWGITVPGMGRAVYAGLRVSF